MIEVNTLVDEADYGAETNVGTAFIPIFIPVGPNTSLRETIMLANDTPVVSTLLQPPAADRGDALRSAYSDVVSDVP